LTVRFQEGAMEKPGIPEQKKPVARWVVERDALSERRMSMRSRKEKEIDTTSEIRRRERPDDLDVLGLGH